MGRLEGGYGQQAGKEIEQELLGTIRESKEIKEERRLIQEIIRRERGSELDAAFMSVKDRQTGSPVNPAPPYANFLRSAVADELGLEDDTVLKFYTAISPDPEKETSLDKDFGIDSFFELEFEGNKFIVSLDITNNPNKNTTRASLIGYVPDDFPIHARFEKGQLAGLTKSEFEIFNTYIEKVSDMIVDKFKKSMYS